MSGQQVTKAVIPAAGLGTRFLPATKAQPKEMLPVVDKPAIQYVVEEAVRAGITDILTKCHGTNNHHNIVHATFAGLTSLKRKEDVARIRGKEVSEIGGRATTNLEKAPEVTNG